MSAGIGRASACFKIRWHSHGVFDVAVVNSKLISDFHGHVEDSMTVAPHRGTPPWHPLPKFNKAIAPPELATEFRDYGVAVIRCVG